MPDVAAPHSKQNGKGAGNMDGGTDVGRGIHRPGGLHQPRRRIVDGDGLRTQVQPIWEQQIQQQADCHAGKHHRTQIKVIGAVTPQQGDQCPGNQEKPGAVSKDEPFVEGNPVYSESDRPVR